MNNLFTPYLDKLSHIFLCAFLVVSIQMFLPLFMVLWITAALSIIKELLDKYVLGSNADWRDLVADVIGMFIGCIPLIIKYFV